MHSCLAQVRSCASAAQRLSWLLDAGGDPTYLPQMESEPPLLPQGSDWTVLGQGGRITSAWAGSLQTGAGTRAPLLLVAWDQLKDALPTGHPGALVFFSPCFSDRTGLPFVGSPSPPATWRGSSLLECCPSVPVGDSQLEGSTTAALGHVESDKKATARHIIPHLFPCAHLSFEGRALSYKKEDLGTLSSSSVELEICIFLYLQLEFICSGHHSRVP